MSKSFDEGGVCRVELDDETKQEIMRDLHWSENTFGNSLRALKKAQIVVKANKILYVFNPEIIEPR